MLASADGYVALQQRRSLREDGDRRVPGEGSPSESD